MILSEYLWFRGKVLERSPKGAFVNTIRRERLPLDLIGWVMLNSLSIPLLIGGEIGNRSCDFFLSVCGTVG